MTVKPLLLASAALVALGACVSQPTYGPNGDQLVQDNNTRTRQGAVIGAAAGALAGAARDADDRNDALRNAAIGAVVGGGAGATVGSILDRQAAALRTGLSNGAIDVVNTGNELIVRMPAGILFPVDSAQLSGQVYGDLRALAANLNQYPASVLEVQGHTDSTGADAYNQQLSERRAQSVGQVLNQNGVAASRITTRGFGETRPVASNDSEQGRAQNRRVDIVITPVR